MRSLLLYFFCFILTFNSYGQKEKNVWYFGNYAGLDFSSGKGTIITNGQMVAREGCSSICDSNGNILLYSNGVGVWGRDHKTLPGGGPLGGDDDAAQSVVIVKQPGHQNIYYLFVNNKYSVRYAIVDLSLNGGIGAVTSKNIVLNGNTDEGLAVVSHCNGQDLWIACHEQGTNRLFCYLLTSSGIDVTPVINLTLHPEPQQFGYLRFSQQGDKIAMVEGLYRCVWTFDNATGKLVKILLDDYGFFQSFGPNYGFEFSPDGTKFYQPSWGKVLYQFDLEAGDTAAVRASQFNIDMGDHGMAWSVTAGPDDRLYLTTDYDNFRYLHVVNDPNERGLACNFQPMAIDFQAASVPPGGISSFFGLPNFPSINYHKVLERPWVTAGCAGQFVLLNGGPAGKNDSSEWVVSKNGSPLFFSRKSLDSVLLQAGNYIAVYTSWSRCGMNQYELPFTVYDKPPVKTQFLTICSNSTVKLHATVEGATNYLWNTGEFDSVINIKFNGVYKCRITRGTCSDTSTFVVSSAAPIWVILGKEYYICEDDSELVLLNAGKGYKDYLWYPTGDTTQWIQVRKTGEYYVMVHDFTGCQGSGGTIVKRRCPGYLYFPNAFSPNGDLVNDEFKPVGGDILQYIMVIYNRWGERIYSSEDFSSRGWDGKFQGKDCPAGEYLFICSYRMLDKARNKRDSYKNGTVVLVR